MKGPYTREYAQQDTMRRAADVALNDVANDSAIRAGVGLAGGSDAQAAGYGYADDGAQEDYYRIGDFIGSDGVLIAPGDN